MAKEDSSVPTHAELERLKIFKELVRVFPETSWTTGPRAYANGTRKITVSDGEISFSYSIYPKNGTIIDSGGYTVATKLGLHDASGWDQAIFRVLVRAIIEWWNRGEMRRPSKSILTKMLEMRRGGEYLKNYLLANPETPIDFIETTIRAAMYPWTLHFAIMNPELPARLLDLVLDQWYKIGGAHSEYFENLIEHPNVTPKIIEKVFDTTGGDPTILDKLAQNPKTPEKILIKLISHDPEIVDKVLKNPSLPRWILDWIQ